MRLICVCLCRLAGFHQQLQGYLGLQLCGFGRHQLKPGRLRPGRR